MKKENPIREKSYAFALHVAKFCRVLVEKQKEYVLSKQLLRSGTSIGANIEEAIHAESKQDFIHKFSIAFKESHESRFWIRLIRDSGYATQEEVGQLLTELSGIIAMLTSILKTSKISV